MAYQHPEDLGRRLPPEPPDPRIAQAVRLQVRRPGNDVHPRLETGLFQLPGNGQGRLISLAGQGKNVPPANKNHRYPTDLDHFFYFHQISKMLQEKMDSEPI